MGDGDEEEEDEEDDDALPEDLHTRGQRRSHQLAGTAVNSTRTTSDMRRTPLEMLLKSSPLFSMPFSQVGGAEYWNMGREVLVDA